MHPRAIVERKARAQERIEAAVTRLPVGASGTGVGSGFKLSQAKSGESDMREMLTMEQVADLLEALAGDFSSGKEGRAPVKDGRTPSHKSIGTMSAPTGE